MASDAFLQLAAPGGSTLRNGIRPRICLIRLRQFTLNAARLGGKTAPETGCGQAKEG
jgi:hypothetical protein